MAFTSVKIIWLGLLATLLATPVLAQWEALPTLGTNWYDPRIAYELASAVNERCDGAGTQFVPRISYVETRVLTANTDSVGHLTFVMPTNYLSFADYKGAFEGFYGLYDTDREPNGTYAGRYYLEYGYDRIIWHGWYAYFPAADFFALVDSIGWLDNRYILTNTTHSVIWSNVVVTNELSWLTNSVAGHLSTNTCYLTDKFLKIIDDKITRLIPYYLDTNYSDGVTYTNWYNTFYCTTVTVDNVVTNWNPDDPTASYLDIMAHHPDIGIVVGVNSNQFGNFTNGAAEYILKPAVTNLSPSNSANQKIMAMSVYKGTNYTNNVNGWVNYMPAAGTPSVAWSGSLFATNIRPHVVYYLGTTNPLPMPSPFEVVVTGQFIYAAGTPDETYKDQLLTNGIETTAMTDSNMTTRLPWYSVASSNCLYSSYAGNTNDVMILYWEFTNNIYTRFATSNLWDSFLHKEAVNDRYRLINKLVWTWQVPKWGEGKAAGGTNGWISQLWTNGDIHEDTSGTGGTGWGPFPDMYTTNRIPDYLYGLMHYPPEVNWFPPWDISPVPYYSTSAVITTWLDVTDLSTNWGVPASANGFADGALDYREYAFYDFPYYITDMHYSVDPSDWDVEYDPNWYYDLYKYATYAFATNYISLQTSKLYVDGLTTNYVKWVDFYINYGYDDGRNLQEFVKPWHAILVDTVDGTTNRIVPSKYVDMSQFLFSTNAPFETNCVDSVTTNLTVYELNQPATNISELGTAYISAVYTNSLPGWVFAEDVYESNDLPMTVTCDGNTYVYTYARIYRLKSGTATTVSSNYYFTTNKLVWMAPSSDWRSEVIGHTPYLLPYAETSHSYCIPHPDGWNVYEVVPSWWFGSVTSYWYTAGPCSITVTNISITDVVFSVEESCGIIVTNCDAVTNWPHTFQYTNIWCDVTSGFGGRKMNITYVRTQQFTNNVPYDIDASSKIGVIKWDKPGGFRYLDPP